MALTYETITAQNTGSTPVTVRNKFTLSMKGTFVATVHIQRHYGDPALEDTPDWLDVTSYTAPVENIGVESDQPVYYRAFVKTGNYTSGTVSVALIQ